MVSQGSSSGSLSRIREVLAALALLVTTADHVPAVTVPFTEGFGNSASGWVIGLVPSGTGSPTWSRSGGGRGGPPAQAAPQAH